MAREGWGKQQGVGGRGMGRVGGGREGGGEGGGRERRHTSMLMFWSHYAHAVHTLGTPYALRTLYAHTMPHLSTQQDSTHQC